MAGKIMTVRGPIEPRMMGFTLPHEHIMVDFIGAEQTGRNRYDREEVVKTMRPYLEDARRTGTTTFVDCTPEYLGRDVEILRTLSEQTGLHILTNTGWYKEPYLPAEAFTLQAGELAERWIQEVEAGIDGTGIRPGFIKTAVNPGELLPIQQKITRAAAITSRATGLVIATHTGVAVAAGQVLDILEEESVDPSRWIYVHAQNEPDHNMILEVARRGCWIELDGLSAGSLDKHLSPLLKLLDAGFTDRVMLSHDAGWYHVGESGGGEKKPYTYLSREFLPLLSGQGVDDETLGRLTVRNPATAFSIGEE